jgi:hypothetical protein
MADFNGDETDRPYVVIYSVKSRRGEGGNRRGIWCVTRGSVSMAGRSRSGARRRCKADGGGSPCFGAGGGRRGGWAGWAKKAEWIGCFGGRKMEECVGLLWMLGRIPKKNRKKCIFLFLAAEMGEFKWKFEF